MLPSSCMRLSGQLQRKTRPAVVSCAPLAERAPRLETLIRPDLPLAETAICAEPSERRMARASACVARSASGPNGVADKPAADRPMRSCNGLGASSPCQRLAPQKAAEARSEEGREGKEGVRTLGSRWPAYTSKKKKR